MPTQARTGRPVAAGAALLSEHAKFAYRGHAGKALGAFRRFIDQPLESGAFARARGRKRALADAAAAAAFVDRELTLAAADVRGSVIGHTLFAPITLVADEVAALRPRFMKGRSDYTAIAAVRSSLSQVQAASAAAGEPIGPRLTPGEQPNGVGKAG